MKRLAFKQLLEWKNKTNRKPLIVQGARQVGKTWLMKEFGRQHYSKVAYISFDANKTANDIFEADYNISNIIQALNILSGVDITPQDTLVIFDEIQECEEALNSLKYFYEDAPEYHVVAAGSLLGVAVKRRNMAVPVGKVRILKLYPITFKEFLRASDAATYNYVNALQEIQRLPEIILNKLRTEYRRYQVSGGMPEAVVPVFGNVGQGIHQEVFLGLERIFHFSRVSNANVLVPFHFPGTLLLAERIDL